MSGAPIAHLATDVAARAAVRAPARDAVARLAMGSQQPRSEVVPDVG
jgi:hypothetical protein